MTSSYVDVRYSHHDHVSDDDRYRGTQQYRSADAALFRHRPEEPGRKHRYRKEHCYRKCCEESRGQLRLGDQGLNLAAHRQTFTNEIGEIGEHFSEVSARLALNEDSRDEHLEVEGVDTAVHAEQGGSDVDTESLLVVEAGEFRPEWLSHLLADELRRCLKRIAGFHRAHEHLDRVRQLFLEFPEALLLSAPKPQEWASPSQHREEHCGDAAVQHAEQCSGHATQAHDEHEGGRPHRKSCLQKLNAERAYPRLAA